MDQEIYHNQSENLEKSFQDFLSIYEEMMSNGKKLHLAIKTLEMLPKSVLKAGITLDSLFTVIAEKEYNKIIEKGNVLFEKLKNMFEKIGYKNFINLLIKENKIDKEKKEVLAKYAWEHMLTQTERIQYLKK
jgi:cupin superfamily acireductone dioxygenase involved in methionine salvage